MNGGLLPEIAEVLGHKTLAIIKRYADLSEINMTRGDGKGAAEWEISATIEHAEPAVEPEQPTLQEAVAAPARLKKVQRARSARDQHTRIRDTCHRLSGASPDSSISTSTLAAPLRRLSARLGLL